MNARTATPCTVLFDVMKRYGGITYKELAVLILSGKPLSDGRSPVSRVNDRTWVSRFIVHAPAGSLQDAYFCDFGISALRVVSRLKSREGRGLSSHQVLDLACAPDRLAAMMEALTACGQNATLYRNMLVRLRQDAYFGADERAEAAIVLMVAAGCTADVSRAVGFTLDFMQSVQGARLATPVTASPLVATLLQDEERQGPHRSCLQLLRIHDGCVVGAPHWIAPSSEGVEIGALSLGECDITDVGCGVSGHHARIWCDDDGTWFIEGMGSRNGTLVRDGATRACTVVEPPRSERNGFTPHPVPLHPGDELLLADDTAFIVLAGDAPGLAMR